jgi:uncharacterized membrane protein
VDRLFPDEMGEGGANGKKQDAPPPPPHTRWHPVPARKDGYLRHVDTDDLLQFAREHHTVVRMERAVGAFVLRDSPLLSLALTEPPGDHMKRALTECCDIDRHRTVEQDAAFGVRQIVDMTLRAMTRSTNDSTTATMCIHYLTAILARLANRDIPSDFRLQDGHLRLIAKGPTFDAMARLAFEEIAGNATGNVTLLVQLLEALETVGSRARDAERRFVLRDLINQVRDNGRRSLEAAMERQKFEERLTRALGAVDATPA